MGMACILKQKQQHLNLLTNGHNKLLLLNVHGGEKAYQGRGRVGKAGQKSETSKQAPTRKTKAAVDRRQNNRMLRQCPSGIAQRPPHHAIAVPTAMQNRQWA